MGRGIPVGVGLGMSGTLLSAWISCSVVFRLLLFSWVSFGRSASPPPRVVALLCSVLLFFFVGVFFHPSSSASSSASFPKLSVLLAKMRKPLYSAIVALGVMPWDAPGSAPVAYEVDWGGAWERPRDQSDGRPEPCSEVGGACSG